MTNSMRSPETSTPQRQTLAEILPGAREAVAVNLALSPIQDRIVATSANVRALRIALFLASEDMPALLGSIMATVRQLLEEQLKNTGFTVGRLKMWLVGGGALNRKDR